MHPYFIFKDLVTIFAFFLALSVMVFFYPNVLGQLWPNIILLIVNIIYACAICWKDILFFSNLFKPIKAKISSIILAKKFKLFKIVKICNKTIYIAFARGLFIIKFLSKYIIIKINPLIVKYYYKISNQQITKLIIKYSLATIN